MLTAALRDLHKCNPGRFITDIRTSAPDLWHHNPYVTPLKEGAADVQIIDCQYPLIHKSNQTPFHFIHGFSQFLAEKLEVPLHPTAFGGDIHLSADEKAWMSQVQEITKKNTPFWIVVAGGKMDFTIKWWSHQRFQEVVNHFVGKIEFVQVGEGNHHHPPLQNVIDLRGKTNIRQLVRLVHHSQGVLCPVTFLMHLAAAVPAKRGPLGSRPCVVVAGGREPSQWEAYPGHRFLHTQGALPCCESGGCWKSRTVPLGDGDEKDRRENLCLRVSSNGLPRCMDIISTDAVIAAIQSYFDGGMIKFLEAPITETVNNAPKVEETGGILPNVRARSSCCRSGISLYSLQRSGTHAIANWITDHYDGRVFYANDCLNCHPDVLSNFESDNLPAFARRELIPVDFFSAAKANLSIVVYEDATPWEKWAGEDSSFAEKSDMFKVLVLRDPFNMIASRIKLAERVPTQFIQDRMLTMDRAGVPTFLSLWKEYAREYIRLRDNPTPGFLIINYNRWVACHKYRREISAKFGRPHRDREKESVPGDGFGSSFDGIRFNQSASRMQVLTRWKWVESDERFKTWSSDKELRELSLEIFGPILQEESTTEKCSHL